LGGGGVVYCYVCNVVVFYMEVVELRVHEGGGFWCNDDATRSVSWLLRRWRQK
jgi:hypothetical protein